MKISTVLCVVSGLGAVACSTPKYTYHSVVKAESCKQEPTRDKINEALVRRGFLKLAERKGVYDVFHRPEIVKKGMLSSEPYEDKAGDFGVAVCSTGKEHYLIAEEWTPCKNNKNCTANDQRELRKLAENWGCQVSERSGRSESWKLEDRQDWTNERCATIASGLTF